MAMFGDISGCPFWRGLVLMGRAQGCCQTPIMWRTAPSQRMIQPKMSITDCMKDSNAVRYGRIPFVLKKKKIHVCYVIA